MHYEIRGRVVQETDRAPVAGLRVEVWDADFLADDLLGSAITGPSGEFVIEFDKSRYRVWIGDHDPDIAEVVLLRPGLSRTATTSRSEGSS